MIDAQNKLSHHLVIGGLTILVALISWWFWDASISRLLGGIPTVLLFLVMIIGPIMKLMPSMYQRWGDFPWSWRAELGIWFAVWAVAHTLYVMYSRDGMMDYILGMSPWAFGALVATLMAIILAAISFRGAINYLGTEAWKWLQNHFTYVIWWLSVVHIFDRGLRRPFLRSFVEDGAFESHTLRESISYFFDSMEFIHLVYVAMIVTVPLLQLLAFVKHVREYRRKNIEKSVQD